MVDGHRGFGTGSEAPIVAPDLGAFATRLMDNKPLSAFGTRLAERRSAILESWRARVHADPRLATGASLPTAQLDDHLTALLEDFERRLVAEGTHLASAVADTQAGDAAAHGLHRWQQGYELVELARELGRLNESVVAEIDRCSGEPGLDAPGLAQRVRGTWAEAHGIAVSESAEQFARLQQIEAAGHVQDLESALQSLRELETQRGALWQQAAHDLRGNLSVVAMATAALARNPERRDRLMEALGSNIRSLTALLADVTTLARLQGGQEARSLAPMDAAETLRELAESTRELATERRLALQTDGPQRLTIEGDAVKVRRIVQNLLLNALRYTDAGSVKVRWGDDPASPASRWFAEVRDTGPGLSIDQGSRLAAAIGAASEHTRKVAEAVSRGAVAHAPAGQTFQAFPPKDRPSAQGPGENIGLSIVKRLCTLLDASVELQTRPGEGSTFRVIFPKRYPG